ncbi:MAG: hypothetical protein COW15_11060 [Shewanella sp. CG12_big_fil_rev_8_21_14_0_65_47_15]|nr:hypothetical protein ABT47_07830 [Shewanella xiamenensis]PIW60786.1 MAG: hypothetical protein COW15_11060 [Shewanella sp. CG12_big_fil_rev_8_21_14_0_65_47_15]HAY96305.1 hypothetical protein [Shewanella sp.]
MHRINYQNTGTNATKNDKRPMLVRLTFFILLHIASTTPINYDLSVHIGEVSIYQSVSINQHEGKGE